MRLAAQCRRPVSRVAEDDLHVRRGHRVLPVWHVNVGIRWPLQTVLTHARNDANDCHVHVHDVVSIFDTFPNRVLSGKGLTREFLVDDARELALGTVAVIEVTTVDKTDSQCVEVLRAHQHKSG